jgi:translation initiation factor 1
MHAVMVKKIATTGGQGLANNAFGGLDIAGLPAGGCVASPKPAVPAVPGWKGRVHLRIEKSGRSGKTVTVLFGDGVEGITCERREELLKTLKNSMGCGGAAAEGLIELQGDVRERVALRLREMGFLLR